MCPATVNQVDKKMQLNLGSGVASCCSFNICSTTVLSSVVDLPVTFDFQERLCGVLYDVVTGDRFEIAILTVIMCNMVLMTIQHHGQSEQVTDTLHILSLRYAYLKLIEHLVPFIMKRGQLS